MNSEDKQKEDAAIICKKLAADLDNNDMSNISTSSTELSKLSLKAVLAAIRSEIGIERLVKNNLDEHPDFGNLLFEINSKADSLEENVNSENND